MLWTLVYTHFYPSRSPRAGDVTLTGEPRFRSAGTPVRILETSARRVLVESTDLPGFAWLNASDLEARS